MPNMFVTREVSKLRGWLKPSACCRGSQAEHIRCVTSCVRAGRRGGDGGGGGRPRGTQLVQGEKRDCVQSI